MSEAAPVSFRFPPAARFGQRLPKEKLYQKGNATHRTRQAIINQVERIQWQYKLAPETINLPASGWVLEIQVIDIILKPGQTDLDEAILQLMDKAIPHPLYFRIARGDDQRFTMGYKRPSEAEKDAWVLGDYFHSPWVKAKQAEQAARPLPAVTNLATLHVALLRSLMALPPRTDEALEDQVQRLAQRATLLRQKEQLHNRLRREKQFNRKVEINHEINALSRALSDLEH